MLFRAASHSAALELELARRNIPYVKYGGLRFFEAAHVKDVLAILRWAENPRDRIAAFRVLQLLPGIGPGTARRVHGRCRRHGSRRWRRAAAGRRGGALAAAGAAPARLAAAPWPAQPALVRAFYDPLLAEIYDFVPSRRADLDQLERLAATVASRDRFLTDLALDPPAASGGAAGPPLQGRGLPDPVDDPLGQGTGMARGVRAQPGRRLHPVRHGDRHAGRASRKSGGCSTSR